MLINWITQQKLLYIAGNRRQLYSQDNLMTDNASPFPLAQARTGEEVFLFSLAPGAGFVGRLTSLGFTPGVEIHMMQNFGHGPLLVSLRGTKVALGRREAGFIMVERCKS